MTHFVRLPGLLMAPAAALGLAALAAAAPAPAPVSMSAGDAVQPFSASYQVAWHGIGAGSSSLTLSAGADGTFTYSSDIQASGLFHLVFPDALVQASTFTLRDGQVAPVSYRETGMARDHSQDVALVFDWNTRQVQGTAGRKTVAAPFPDGVLDPMSVQVELMRQLRAGRQPTHFTLWDKDEAKEYRYTRERTEKLDTPLGQLDTVLYRSDRPDSDRVTRLWLAPALGWLPVQAARSRGDSTDLSMRITSTTLQSARP